MRRASGSAGRGPRYALRAVALGYLFALLLAPVGTVLYKTFAHGVGPVWTALTQHDAVHAFLVSLELVGIAVPLNTAFGIAIALVLTRTRIPGRALLSAIVDIPFAISPVVAGLALLLVYGRLGWFGEWLVSHGLPIIFSLPGMALATAFVSLPFVTREVTPVLRELGTDAEQAAATLGASPWQTFWRVTMPSIRWAVIYGVVLTTARALGEFGAVSVVSGNFVGKSQSLPLYVSSSFENFNVTGAYAAATLMALIAIATLGFMTLATGRRAVA